MPLINTLGMTPWEVIDGALGRMNPKQDQAWLAKKLGISEQAVSNWKARGVPRGKYVDLSKVLGLTMEQIAGLAPVPWEKDESEWPFPDIDRARWARLTDIQRGEIQGKVRELLEEFENQRATGSGKSSTSSHRPPKRGFG